jgi:hypothetical protein
MNAPDVFALGGRQDDDILALLHQWIELRRAADRASDTDDDVEWSRSLDEADAIEARIRLLSIHSLDFSFSTDHRNRPGRAV